MGTREHRLEYLQTTPAELFEKRHLWLHDGNLVGDAVEDCEQKLLDHLRGLRIARQHAAAAEQWWQVIQVRIEADAQGMTEGADARDHNVCKMNRCAAVAHVALTGSVHRPPVRILAMAVELQVARARSCGRSGAALGEQLSERSVRR